MNQLNNSITLRPTLDIIPSFNIRPTLNFKSSSYYLRYSIAQCYLIVKDHFTFNLLDYLLFEAVAIKLIAWGTRSLCKTFTGLFGAIILFMGRDK